MSKENFKEYAYFTYFILIMIPTFVFVLCNSWLGIMGIYRTLKFGHILVTDNLISNVKYKVEEFTGMSVDKINIYIEGVRVID